MNSVYRLTVNRDSLKFIAKQDPDHSRTHSLGIDGALRSTTDRRHQATPGKREAKAPASGLISCDF